MFLAIKNVVIGLALVLGLCASITPAQAQTKVQRLALVIGNSAYKDAPLLNPVNDARAMSQALKDSGFVVIARENADQRAMLTALREFGDRLKSAGAGGAVGVFYYAGHGMQIKGRNYLVPINAAIEREDEVAYNAIDGQAVLDKMEAAGNGTNIMILDACRNNPFARSFRSAATGLAQMDAPVGTLVSFATSPGAVASDGTGKNGLFTQHLLTAMRQPGAKVEEVFKQVRANVRRDSQGKQVPWESTSLEGDFYFHPPVAGAAVGALPAVAPGVAMSIEASVETALWDAVKDSSQPAELRAYLGRFPQGRFFDQAQERLTALQPSDAAATVAAEMPSPSMPTAVKTPVALPRSANGHTVGDRWRYQVVDKYKGEVVRNWTWKVDEILPNGDMYWNDGNILASPIGSFRFDKNTDWPVRIYSADNAQVPDQLVAGHRQSVKYAMTATRAADNLQYVEDYSGTLVVKGRERVKVPAGEFDAFRIERNVTITGRRTNGSGQWYGHQTRVSWYVPELHNFVAWDSVLRFGNQPATIERIELTSYEVDGATLAQK